MAERSDEPRIEVNSPNSSGRPKALKKKLDELRPTHAQPFIFKVHKSLRDMNEKEYEPQLISIGPYHRGKDELEMMEKHKLKCLKQLLKQLHERKRYVQVEDLIATVAEVEQKARDCYAESTDHISSTEFIEMLVLDGCFIIELLFGRDSTRNDPIFQTLWIQYCLRRDMMLFENQIPFFVLWKLFDLIVVPNIHKLLVCRVLNSFRRLCPGSVKVQDLTTINSGWWEESKHILDLLHKYWCTFPSDSPDGDGDANIIVDPLIDWCTLLSDSPDEGKLFINSASELGDANVKFQVLKESKTMFEVEFKRGIMSIPPLKIYDDTECVFRNLIAFEQYFPNEQPTCFTDYAILLDCLINSSADVKLLSEHGIIESHLGNNEATAKIFNQITLSVTVNPSKYIYDKTFHLINAHYKKPTNKAIANLKRNYFNSPWAYISFSAALLLLLLTIAQTVLSALQLP